jgi:deoxyadenosine/deoxycytidine kinase
MAYLKAWHYFLKQRPPSNDDLTVFDQGPIYRLALLREFGPEITKSRSYRRWWNDTLNQWATTLDLAIWLDAPDHVLTSRILSRNSWHRAKNKTQQEILAFLARYRSAYEQVMAKLAAGGDIRIYRLNTGDTTPDEVVTKALAAFDEHARVA